MQPALSDDGSSNPLHAPEPARDKPADPKVSARYSNLSRRDTSPEMELRRALWRIGLRYRVQYKVPGIPRRKVDIAFPGKKVAVQVDGCFWHGCPEHGMVPVSHAEYWEPKLARNVERDAETTAMARAEGWRVLRIWEHVSAADAVQLIVRTLEALEEERERP